MERYLIALGSNMRHHRCGRPRDVLRAALDECAARGLVTERVSSIFHTPPLGPSRRRYANAAAIIAARLAPEALLDRLQDIERRFGRRPGGRRWRARPLDLDIVLWEGGVFASDRLVIPHPAFRQRDFVLRPAVQIAPGWRDPLTGLTLQHLHTRLTRARPARR